MPLQHPCATAAAESSTPRLPSGDLTAMEEASAQRLMPVLRDVFAGLGAVWGGEACCIRRGVGCCAAGRGCFNCVG